MRCRFCTIPGLPVIVWLLASLAPAAPGLAQLLSDQDLPPAEALEVSLSQADLRISWRGAGPSHMKAAPARPQEAAAAPAGPALSWRLEGGTLELTRSPEAGAVRLAVELVVSGARRLRIVGSGLDLVVAPPVENGRRVPAALLSLGLEGSNAELNGLAGGFIEGRNSRVTSRHGSEELRVGLEGGGAEIETHRGRLQLQGAGSEFVVRQVEGELALDLEAGRCELLQSQGRLDASLSAGATLLVAEWSGEANLAASGANLDLRNFWPEPQILRIKADETAVLIEGLEQAEVDFELEGGSLRLSDLKAIQGKISTNLEAKVEILRMNGGWGGLFQDSEVSIEKADQLNLEVYNGQLDIDEVEELSLIAHGSTVTAFQVSRITSLNMVTSQGEFGVLEGGRAEVMVQGLSEAIFNLATPCFVAIPEPGGGEGEEPDHSRLEISGCTLGGEPAEGAEEATVLSGTVGGNSRVDARASF